MTVSNTYNNYGKFEGWNTARKMSLPTSSRLWILNKSNYHSVIKSLIDFSDDYVFMCRPDAPKGKGNKLPRGRGLVKKDFLKFYLSYNKTLPDSVLLIFEDPAISLTGFSKERYEINGGIMLYFEQSKRILLEYVGRGFDVGDITRGENFHTRIVLPWWILEGKLDNFFLKKIFNSPIIKKTNISAEDYLKSREIRIDTLVNTFGEKDEDAIIKSIPTFTPHFSYDFFQKLIKLIICPTLKNIKLLEQNTNFGVLVNIYEEEFYVFEIWFPNRSFS